MYPQQVMSCSFHLILAREGSFLLSETHASAWILDFILFCFLTALFLLYSSFSTVTLYYLLLIDILICCKSLSWRKTTSQNSTFPSNEGTHGFPHLHTQKKPLGFLHSFHLLTSHLLLNIMQSGFILTTVIETILTEIKKFKKQFPCGRTQWTFFSPYGS